MLIESVTPLTVKLSTGDIRLTPGVAVELPTAQAERLLAKAPGKVREVITDWLAAWRELAALTYGITGDDPLFSIVMYALNQCDDAYLSGNWAEFRQAAARVRSAMVKALDPIPTIRPGDRITWQGSDGTATNGVIDFLHTYPGEVWAFCTLPDGRWTAVNVKNIRKVEASC